MFRFVIFAALIALSTATSVNNCDGKPPTNAVRIAGCETPPCKVIKGKSAEVEVDFTLGNPAKALKAEVLATVLGITVPYALPADVADVCKNLMDEAYCPLDADEDVTYKLLFPIASIYPEVRATIEISIVDENKNVATCFRTDIQVSKS